MIAAGILYSWFWHHRHVLSDGEFTRWGAGQILQLLAFMPNSGGYYKLIYLKVMLLTRIDGMMILACSAAARRGAVGQQRKTAYAAQPNPYRTGGGRRHDRWLRRARR